MWFDPSVDEVMKSVGSIRVSPAHHSIERLVVLGAPRDLVYRVRVVDGICPQCAKGLDCKGALIEMGVAQDLMYKRRLRRQVSDLSLKGHDPWHDAVAC